MNQHSLVPNLCDSMTDHITKSTCKQIRIHCCQKHVQLLITSTHINSHVPDSVPAEISGPEVDNLEQSGSLRKPLEGVCGEYTTVT